MDVLQELFYKNSAPEKGLIRAMCAEKNKLSTKVMQGHLQVNMVLVKLVLCAWCHILYFSGLVRKCR